MIITIESTDRIVTVNGIEARIWEGETASGIRVGCLVTRIAAKKDQDLTQFETELKEQAAPTAEALRAFPLRMIL